MPLGSLWTPGGEIPLRQKDVIPLSREEIVTFAELDQIARRYKLQLTCLKCDKPILGVDNARAEQNTLSVACNCREFRFKR